MTRWKAIAASVVLAAALGGTVITAGSRTAAAAPKRAPGAAFFNTAFGGPGFTGAEDYWYTLTITGQSGSKFTAEFLGLPVTGARKGTRVTFKGAGESFRTSFKGTLSPNGKVVTGVYSLSGSEDGVPFNEKGNVWLATYFPQVPSADAAAAAGVDHPVKPRLRR